MKDVRRVREAAAVAPGLVRISGAYSVLNGGPAYSVALRTGVHAWVGEEGTGVNVRMLQFRGLQCRLALEDGAIVQSPDLRDNEKAWFRYIGSAVELALRYFAYIEKPIGGAELITINEKGFTKNLGLSKPRIGGSSAAVTAAIAALFEYSGLPLDENKGRVHNLAQIAHRKAQGFGSGWDVSTSVYGTQVYRLQKSIPEQLTDSELVDAVEAETPVPESKPFPDGIDVLIEFAKQEAPIKDMITAVQTYGRSNPAEYGSIMEKLDRANSGFVQALDDFRVRFRAETPEATKEQFREIGRNLKESRKQLKLLGERAGAPIEPDNITDALNSLEEVGAFGALQGGGGGYSAFVLCPEGTFYDADSILRRTGLFEPLTEMEIDRTSTGVRIEPPTDFYRAADDAGLIIF